MHAASELPMSSRGRALRLLAELVMRADGHGDARRWRRYTAAEIAAGVQANGGSGTDDLGELTQTIAAVLDGRSEDVPDDLVEPLAAFFRAPVVDLTREDPQVTETAVLERLVRELGAGGVLFCRDHLDRQLANRLLRAVLDALRQPSKTGCSREQPP
jgi:hypothetical protein